jgi:hypothetical protein
MLGMKLRGAAGFFDRWASTYDRSIHQKLMFEPIHQAGLDAFSGAGAAPHDVLDVGTETRSLDRRSRGPLGLRRRPSCSRQAMRNRDPCDCIPAHPSSGWELRGEPAKQPRGSVAYRTSLL